MKNFKNRLNFLNFRRLLLVLAFACINIILFQNCSKTDFVPSDSDYVDANADNPLYAEGKFGEQVNLPDLKLIFVVDNSYTMSSSNLKISESFDRLFDGTNSESLRLFNTEVFLLSTAQNLYKDRNTSFSRQIPSYQFLAANNYKALVGKSAAEIRQHRNYPNNGKIPGDIAGFELAVTGSQPEGTQLINFNPAPVVGLSHVNGNGVEKDLSAKKSNSESVAELDSDFKERLNVLNPINNEIDNQSALGETLSEESGLCTLARVLKHPEKFFKSSDFVSFILVSDEDDSYNDGKNCFDKIMQKPHPKEQVDGNCKWSESKLRYKLHTTRFSYQAKVASDCTLSKSNQFNLKYKFKPFSNTVEYYLNKEIIRDGKHILVVDPNKQFAKLNMDLTGKCNKTFLNPYLPGATVYDNTSYPIVCSLTPAGQEPPEPERSSDDVLGRKIGFTDAQLQSFGIAKGDVGGTNSVCTENMRSYLTEIDGRLKRTERQLDYCYIKGYYFDNGNPRVSKTANQSSEQCQESNQNCNSISNQKCTAVYTPVPPSGFSNTLQLTVNERGLECNTSCGSTAFCSSQPTKKVEEYIASLTALNNIRNCTAAEAVTDSIIQPSSSFYLGRFSCDSYCKDTSYCPNEGNKKVKDYLEEQLRRTNSAAKLSECEVTTENKQIPFGPVEKNTTYCLAGQTPADVKPNYKVFVDDVKYVSGNKTNGDVSSNLTDYIKTRTEQFFNQNKPVYSVFVLQPGDVVLEGQSVGNKYNRLADKLNGYKSSILENDYSPALVKVSDLIKEKMGRTIFFPQVKSYHIIRKVWINGYQLMPVTDWTSTGGTVTFSQPVVIDHLAQVKIQFY